MTSGTTTSTWDLSPVFNLIQTLSSRDSSNEGRVGEAVTAKKTAISTGQKNEYQDVEKSLGDFGSLWDFLGVQRNVPAPTVPTFEASTAVQAKEIDAYASDGALYYPPSSKSVKWRDEEEGLNLTDVQPDSPPEDGQLTKNQRKKRNRRARKAADAAGATNTAETAATAAIAANVSKKKSMNTTQAKKDAVQTIALMSTANSTTLPVRERPIVQAKENDNHLPPKPHAPASGELVNAAPRQLSTSPRKPAAGRPVGNVNTASPKSNGLFRPAQVTPANAATVSHSSPAPQPSFMKVQITATDRAAASHSSPAPQLTFTKAQGYAVHKTPQKPIIGTIHQSLQKQWPVADPHGAAQKVSLTPNPPRTQPKSSAIPANSNAVVTTTRTDNRKRYEILPLQFNNSVDRNWSLLMKLMHNFPEDRAHLLSPLQLSINRPTSNGIHVFVDASNIIIGFNETLKRARGIPFFARVPRVDLNFHALALLLERRRPVSKRVLAGSTPEIPAFEEARQVGYETCILDKVWKAKELTERQRRFTARSGGDSSGYQSGSDSAAYGLLGTSPGKTPATPPQQPKWVEQAVDEILHLKILESIVDTPSTPVTPEEIMQAANGVIPDTGACPTMILATGDAAEAEYSPGFQKMVTRALQKGWVVEVMAWGKSISAEYRRMTQSPALAGRFKLIELDEYAEELFGEAV